ncbi:MAG: (Fe-S)-binding protein [Actinomycetaceae bacterium]|nr:(Fe-S)-binding protein [Actinomycetaceae bacterium]
MTPSDVRTAALFVALVVTLIGLISFTRGIIALLNRVRDGQPQPGRLRPVGRRTVMLLTTILSHREFKGRPLIRVAHWFVMLSFPILFLTLITGYGQILSPGFAIPVVDTFAPWEWLVEIFAWGSFIGIAWLIVFRLRVGHGSEAEARADIIRDGKFTHRASRFLGSTRWHAWFIEGVIFTVVLCVIGLRAFVYAAGLNGITDQLDAPILDPSYVSWVHFPLTGWLGRMVSGLSSSTIINTITLLSLLKVIVSMSWMAVVGLQTTMGIAWHRFLAVINVYARTHPDGSKSLGPAAPLIVDGKPIRTDEDLEELDDDAVLGVGTAADLTWKARLDLSTCTECGRCQELCPAWNTGKPLSPKLLIMAMRDHANALDLTSALGEDAIETTADGTVVSSDWPDTAHTGDVLGALIASRNTGDTGVAMTQVPIIGEVVPEEVLWDCTMCGACVDQCPVDIEHIDHVLSLRRHQVLMESAFPRELARPFRSLETKGNPYNQPARKRLEWAKNLDFDVPVIGEDVEDARELDWVLWVGCAGAYDDRAKKTTAAIAELLHIAGVSYGVLGNAESCTGDPARRAGNELLFQMLAEQAIETLNESHVKRIVVSCAHCFNTIANEYPELGGTYEVIHHTQLLNRLVREGRLKLMPPQQGQQQRITYHDPCYLGRHNQVFSPPRELLGADSGLNLVEMPRNRDGAMCCGAGGARAWMEETDGTRISQARVDEAASVGASVIATGCPFCTQMLSSTPLPHGSDASNEDSNDVASQPLVIQDVATLILEAVKRNSDHD